MQIVDLDQLKSDLSEVPKRRRCGRVSAADGGSITIDGLSGAARLLGCHRGTIWNYTRDFPNLRADRLKAKAEVSEMAEDNVVGAIVDGDVEASKWWLTRIKGEEFSTRVEVTGKGGGAIEHTVTSADVQKEVGDIFGDGQGASSQDG